MSDVFTAFAGSGPGDENGMHIGMETLVNEISEQIQMQSADRAALGAGEI